MCVCVCVCVCVCEREREREREREFHCTLIIQNPVAADLGQVKVRRWTPVPHKDENRSSEEVQPGFVEGV